MWSLNVWISLLAGFLLVAYLWGTRRFAYFKNRGFPYKASPVPYFGSMAPFVFKQQSLSDMVKSIYDSYPDHKLIGLFEFMKPVVMVRDPELIKLVTVKDFDHFVGKTNHRVVPLTEAIDPLLGKNLLGLQGNKWKETRSTLSPLFTTSKIKGMFDFVTEIGKQLNDFLDEQCKKGGGSAEMEMKDLFSRYTNDVTATSVFGVRCDSLKEPNNEFFQTGKDITNFGGTNALIFFGFRLSNRVMKMLGFTVFRKQTRMFFESVIHETVALREKEGIIRPDMIHLMMEARKGTITNDVNDDTTDDIVMDEKLKRKFAAQMTDADFTAQAVLFYLAGFDTASTNLAFLFMLLASHTDVQDRLRTEIDEMMEANGGTFSYDSIAGMKYLDMCISEALRLWPPAIMTNRLCVKTYIFPATDTSPAIKINPGDGIWIPTFGIHRDPKYYQDPDTYNPERFSDENKASIDPYTNMPFGTGPRKCIGMRFALMETKIAVCMLLSRFTLQTNATNQALARKTFNVGYEKGFWLRFTPRT